MTKLHPLTVPYRILSSLGSILLIVVASVVFGSQSPEFGPVILVLGLVAVLVLGIYQYAYYRRFEYEVTEDTFDVDSGVFSRQRREVPLSRVQNVDVSQNIVQRLVGISVVDIETAGGGDTEVQLRFVDEAEGHRLTDVLQGRATPEATDDEGQTRGTVLFELDDDSLLLLSALSFDLRLFTIVPTLAALGAPSLVDPFLDLPTEFRVPLVIVAVVASLVGGWLIGAIATYIRYHGFRLSQVGEELRYERGLLQRYSGTIPLEKLQTVTVRENVLMRRYDFAALDVETAGYAGGGGPSGGSQAAIPLAGRAEVIELAQRLEPFGDVSLTRLPDRSKRRYRRRYRLASLVVAVVVGLGLWLVEVAPMWAAVGAGVVVLAGVGLSGPGARATYRHRGYDLLEDYAVTQRGFWRRRTTVVPDYRIQTVGHRASVFQRRWNLASVELDTAGSLSLSGPTGVAVDLDTDAATDLQETVADRLQAALVERRQNQRTDTSG